MLLKMWASMVHIEVAMTETSRWQQSRPLGSGAHSCDHVEDTEVCQSLRQLY